MKKSLIATFIAAALVTAPVHAEELDRQQQGGGIGLLIGAIAGGPLGAVVGGALGAGVGHDLDREIAFEARGRALEEQRAEAERLRERSRLLAARLAEAESSATADANLLLALSAGVSLKIHFRSASERLEPFELERLAALAAFLEAAPGLKVALAGHADPRGGERANRLLSERRVAVVRGALERAGIASARIAASAFGEQRPLSQPGDNGAYPFDRRVTVTLVME